MEISRQTGIKVLVSHISSGFTIYPPAPDKLECAAAEATLDVIDEAIAAGVAPAFDVIPHTDGGGLRSPYLCGVLVPWIRETGSVEGLVRALGMRDFREEVRRTLEAGRYWLFQPKADPGWAGRGRFLQANDPAWVGKSVADLAAARGGMDPLEALFDL